MGWSCLRLRGIEEEEGCSDAGNDGDDTEAKCEELAKVRTWLDVRGTTADEVDEEAKDEHALQ